MSAYSIVLGTGTLTHITATGRRTFCGRRIRGDVFDSRGIGVATYDGVLPKGPLSCGACYRRHLGELLDKVDETLDPYANACPVMVASGVPS